jgi:AbrB family looped-hinge helix DNA binding protein
MVMDEAGSRKVKTRIKGVVVKGYQRPDGTYYVSIPKQIREALDLKGGELFLIKVKPEERKISATIIDIPGEDHE